MIEFSYEREGPYPLTRTLSQYFDLEHLEHVHPRSFGKASLLSQHGDMVVWDLESPPILGIVRVHHRVVQRFLPPDCIHATLVRGLLRGTEVEIRFRQTPDGTLIKERYHVPLPSWLWLHRIVERRWCHNLDRIWEEDLRVGVCHGGWPGVP